MLFNSLAFWLFLPCCLLLYWIIPNNRVVTRNAFLLCVSYFFYSAWDYRFLSLILLSTVIDYTAAIAMSDASSRARKWWLYFSVFSNIGILGFFKYFNFFLDSVNMFFVTSNPLSSLNIILPIGISFYTFQSLSYTIDVYRGHQKPEKRFVTFALYVSFFPQLLAGPIERAGSLIPQLKSPVKFNPADLKIGFRRFLLGMVKKVTISPAIFEYSDSLFLNPTLNSGMDAWIKGFFWFLYLLMDFSGYSDMAIGIARMLGIRLSENFNAVLKTQNFPDFWKRWHITLGEWFKDYVFSPIRARGYSKYFAGFLTFTLIGFWHGASWNFLLWGMGLGVFWCIDVRFRPIERIGQVLPSAIRPMVNTIGFLSLFLINCSFFPARDIGSAVTIIKSMIGIHSFQNGLSTYSMGAAFQFAAVLALGIELFQSFASPKVKSDLEVNQVYRNLRLFLFIPCGIVLCIEGLWSSAEFEYFQF